MDANKLRGKIVEKGHTMAEVAEMIGINRTAFYRKLSQHERMTVSDAVKIKDALGLTNLEALEIFLSRTSEQ